MKRKYSSPERNNSESSTTPTAASGSVTMSGESATPEGDRTSYLVKNENMGMLKLKSEGERLIPGEATEYDEYDTDGNIPSDDDDDDYDTGNYRRLLAESDDSSNDDLTEQQADEAYERLIESGTENPDAMVKREDSEAIFKQDSPRKRIKPRSLKLSRNLINIKEENANTLQPLNESSITPNESPFSLDDDSSYVPSSKPSPDTGSISQDTDVALATNENYEIGRSLKKRRYGTEEGFDIELQQLLEQSDELEQEEIMKSSETLFRYNNAHLDKHRYKVKVNKNYRLFFETEAEKFFNFRNEPFGAIKGKDLDSTYVIADPDFNPKHFKESNIEDEYKSIPSAYWTLNEKELFFSLLSRFSIHRLDAIAENMKTKSKLEILAYYQLLKWKSKKLKLHSTRFLSSVGMNEIPIAYEMSEYYIAAEECLATRLRRYLSKREVEKEKLVKDAIKNKIIPERHKDISSNFLDLINTDNCYDLTKSLYYCTGLGHFGHRPPVRPLADDIKSELTSIAVKFTRSILSELLKNEYYRDVIHNNFIENDYLVDINRVSTISEQMITDALLDLNSRRPSKLKDYWRDIIPRLELKKHHFSEGDHAEASKVGINLSNISGLDPRILGSFHQKWKPKYVTTHNVNKQTGSNQQLLTSVLDRQDYEKIKADIKRLDEKNSLPVLESSGMVTKIDDSFYFSKWQHQTYNKGGDESKKSGRKNLKDTDPSRKPVDTDASYETESDSDMDIDTNLDLLADLRSSVANPISIESMDKRSSSERSSTPRPDEIQITFNRQENDTTESLVPNPKPRGRRPFDDVYYVVDEREHRAEKLFLLESKLLERQDYQNSVKYENILLNWYSSFKKTVTNTDKLVEFYMNFTEDMNIVDIPTNSNSSRGGVYEENDHFSVPKFDDITDEMILMHNYDFAEYFSKKK
ncbi:nucleic acid binding protein [[Candida] boidinii]|nr:nucleic acid binding protein [[Candida] boidinii]